MQIGKKFASPILMESNQAKQGYLHHRNETFKGNKQTKKGVLEVLACTSILLIFAHLDGYDLFTLRRIFSGG